MPISSNSRRSSRAVSGQTGQRLCFLPFPGRRTLGGGVNVTMRLDFPGDMEQQELQAVAVALERMDVHGALFREVFSKETTQGMG
jgi:hypothetical protein